MSTFYHFFTPEEAQFLATSFPAIVKNNGTNFPVSGLAFDGAADEAAFWKFVAVNYGSGNLTLTIYWYADSGTTGDVVWDAQISAITPNTDSQDIETDGLATVQSFTDSHLGTTAQRLHSCDIAISNLDSLAAGDFVHLRLNRDANNAADTMNAVDAIVVGLLLSYSDT